MPISVREREGGFTLAEMLVVLAIVALAAGLVVGRGKPGGAVQSAAAVQTYLREARAHAMETGRPVQVVIDEPTGRIAAAAPLGVLDLPAGIRLSAAAPRGQDGRPRIAFWPDGSSGGGSLVLQPARGRSYALQVSPLVGAVAVAQ